MSALTATRFTVEQYFALEAAGDVKHEFFRGEIFAMSGGSEPHALVGANCIRELGNALKGRPCRVYTSDMRVKCPTGLYTYPDVSALCGSPEFEPDRNDVIRNPSVLFEVLSPSTAGYDRFREFFHYSTIPTLRDYVLVDQDSPCIQRFSRGGPNDPWTLAFITGLDSSLELPSLGVSIPLTEIYANVALKPNDFSEIQLE